MERTTAFRQRISGVGSLADRTLWLCLPQQDETGRGAVLPAPARPPTRPWPGRFDYLAKRCSTLKTTGELLDEQRAVLSA